jgi:probable F420-dependent oxidoreductase
MDIGISIPARGPLASEACIRGLAQGAERLDFRHLAVPDHILVPRSIDSTYPYSAGGEFPGAASGDSLEQFTLLAWLAAINTTAKLVTSVAVVPHRGAVHTAKIVSTIDVLSGGRMVVGVGAGWMREEFEAVGAPPFAARGRVTDEYIQAMKILWTEDDPQFEGEFVSFRDISFLPRGVQHPHPPVWVGGESKAAMRRTVRFGDVWYPIGANPRHPLNTPARIRGGIERLHRLAEEHDRDPAGIGLAYFVNAFDESKTVTTDDGERQILSGSAADLAEDIEALEAMGFTDLVLNFGRGTLERSLHSMEWFAEEVRAKL